MRWDDRQRAMLEEIGVRLWLPDEPTAPLAAPADAPTHAGHRRHEVESDAEVDAEASDVLALDWAALAERAAGCTACALCDGRTHSVFGAGNLQADWLIVGDAPDADDDRSGVPFDGSAGRLLDNMLGAIGLTRGHAAPAHQVYATRAVKCQPPGRRNPEPGEVARCEPFLQRQVELLQPRIIVAMGRIAAQGLTRSADAIGRLRGRVHRYRGVPLVVTYAPEYLLRHPQDKAGAWDDLCLALQSVNEGRSG
jgi:uracil-DNA glycosylase